jgi:hypothetical protein
MQPVRERGSDVRHFDAAERAARLAQALQEERANAVRSEITGRRGL